MENLIKYYGAKMSERNHVVCRNCRRPVAVTHKKVKGKLVNIHYAHGMPVAGVECTKLDPIFVEELSPDQVLICDFCSAPSPEWSYPCGDFQMPTFLLAEGEVMDYNLIGWWAACSKCKTFIDAEDWEGTARRYIINHPVEDDFRIGAWKSLISLHKTFGRYRTGDAIENIHLKGVE